MDRTDAINGIGLVLTLAAAAGASAAWGSRDESRSHAAGSASESTTEVRDAGGIPVEVREYRRIASASAVADEILVELIEPSRIVAITAHTRRTSPTPWRYAAIETIESLDRLETVIGLSPDLVLVNELADSRRIARLREAGLVVFDLGSIEGLRTLLASVRTLATLFGVPERGDRLAATFEQRMRSVADDIDPVDRPAALYLGVHGGSIYGGANGTSFHDILVHAGLRDAATEAGYSGWPSYTAEDLLTINPEWIVTQEGRTEALCRLPGLADLRACRDERVLGIDDRLLSNAAFGMLPAAEALRRAVYGTGREPNPAP